MFPTLGCLPSFCLSYFCKLSSQIQEKLKYLSKAVSLLSGDAKLDQRDPAFLVPCPPCHALAPRRPPVSLHALASVPVGCLLLGKEESGLCLLLLNPHMCDMTLLGLNGHVSNPE